MSYMPKASIIAAIQAGPVAAATKANALAVSGGGSVNVAAATAPVGASASLVSTDSSHATWQRLAVSEASSAPAISGAAGDSALDGGPTGDTVAGDLVLGENSNGVQLCTKSGYFGTAPVVQQSTNGTLTNNVTAGGTNNTIDTFVGSSYATDGATIRNNLYQLARLAKIHRDALRAYAFGS